MSASVASSTAVSTSSSAIDQKDSPARTMRVGARSGVVGMSVSCGVGPAEKLDADAVTGFGPAVIGVPAFTVDTEVGGDAADDVGPASRGRIVGVRTIAASGRVRFNIMEQGSNLVREPALLESAPD